MPSQQDSILADVADLLAKVGRVDSARVAREVDLETDLGIDSLTMIDLVVAAEDRFEVRILDEDVERLRTVGDVVDYVLEAQAGDLGRR